MRHCKYQILLNKGNAALLIYAPLMRECLLSLYPFTLGYRLQYLGLTLF